MNFRTKAGIVAIIVGLVLLSDLAKKSAEAELKLHKLELCGLDIDRLDTKTKNRLGTASDVELYYVCEQIMRQQQIERMKQGEIKTISY